MQLNQKQIESVLALPGRERYLHFINTIVDWEEIWGLYKDGWALASDGEKTLFPLWPAEEYAELCAMNQWKGYEAKKFSLDELGEELLPSLEKDNILPAIFYTPKEKGIVVSIEEFINDLNNEIDKY